MTTSIRYDRQDVISKATNLFWEKGFHATSMRNLQEAIDLRPGSIYAGFGSKEGLFKEALQNYASNSRAAVQSLVEENDSPLEALEMFLNRVVLSQSKAPSNMCMLVKTISELTEDNAELLAEAQQLLETVEAAFADAFALAQTNGELDSNKDPVRLASLFQVQVMGLRAYARANDCSETEAKALIKDTFASLL